MQISRNLPERCEHSSDKVPSWFSLVAAFAAGAVITASVFSPSILSPDYQRGHSDGYSAGREDALSEIGAEHADLLRRVVDAEKAILDDHSPMQ